MIGTLVGKQDSDDSWDLLKRMYNASDQQQILFFTNKLYNLNMKDGEDVSSYLMDARNLCNHLTTLRKMVSDEQLMNVILKGLLVSFKMIIQSISYMTTPTFKDIMGKFL